MMRQFWLFALVTFFAAVGQLSHAQQVPEQLIRYADLVLYNGSVLTVDDRFTVAEAVAVRDGRILDVGPTDRVLRLAGPKTRKVDLGRSKAVIPGIINTHTHPNRYAVAHYWNSIARDEREIVRADTIESGKFQSKDEVLVRIKAIVEGSTNPARKWIRITWNPPRGQPRELVKKDDDMFLELSKEDLDKLCPDMPLVLKRRGAARVNSKGLAEFLGRFGNLLALKDNTGLFSGTLYELLSVEILPHLSREVLASVYRKELQDWWAPFGVTTISTRLKAYEIASYALLDQKGELPVRLAYAHEIGLRNPFFERDVERSLDNIQNYGTDALWMVGISVQPPDGSPSGTGVCSSFTKIRVLPQDLNPQGWCRWELPNDITRQTVLTLTRLGYRVAGTHQYGDKGREMLLDAVLEAAKDPSVAAQRRTALDHGQMANPSMIKKAGDLKAIWGAHVDKFWDTKGRADAELVEAMYGIEVADRMLMPLKSLLDAGATVSYESGSPGLWDGEGRDPMFGMEVFVTRKNESGRVRGEREKLDRKTALRILTRGGAEYVLREKELGSIEVGKLADLVVLDSNPLDPSIADEELSEIQVLMTLLGGKVVSDAATFTPPLLDVRSAEEYSDFFDRE